MGACTVSSISELTRVLLARRDFCLCVKHAASDDIIESLLTKASRLKTDGERVLIVCADDVVAARYYSRLPLFLGLSNENITTMRELSSQVLARPEIRRTLGRGPRVLDDNEHDVLLEDLKTSGVRPRRLREMLKFFYRNLSHCPHEDTDWLLTAEERTVYALLTENLAVRQAVLPCEMASLACRGLLEAEPAVGGEPATAIVDGYETLSEASQFLLDILFPNCLIVAGSTSEAQSFAEPYPNFQGFSSFCDTHANAELIELETSRPAGEEVRLSYADPVAEFEGVTAAIASHLAFGIAPRDVLVAVPNLTWGRRVVAELARKGIRAALDEGPVKIEGDPRTFERCENLRLAAFLKLFLDSRDFTALRSWLGFGDWLLRSDAFLDLMAYAQSQKLDMQAAIEELHNQAADIRLFPTFTKLEGPLAELDALRQACADISRKDAITLFAQHKMPLDEHMVEMLGPHPQHADITELASHGFAAAPAADVDTLIVAPYQRCYGRHVRVTFLTGLVNGFLPGLDAVDDRYTIDHRSSALNRERKLFETIKATASEKLICSYFQRDRIENAERLNMQTTRLFVKDTTRYATVAPSVFLTHQGERNDYERY
ncbi:MAG: hypothetical protein LBL27_01165 [Coriobacteriales bacterium]|jgi:hypothetical protein|nr:hypothetical protein [Coriobacteriales bacterium]